MRRLRKSFVSSGFLSLKTQPTDTILWWWRMAFEITRVGKIMKAFSSMELPRIWTSCKPSVSRYWLLLTAGATWSVVGLVLCGVACYWLSQTPWPGNAVAGLVGFACGVLVYRFGFSRIARRNIARIAGQPDEVCVFAFQAWRSYILIVGMMALGWVLRHSRLPLLVLAIIYLTIGTALALSSSLYYDQS